MTTTRPSFAGPRQTVDRVEHPHRGLGYAVFDNGEPCFVADDGERTSMPIGLGGASVTEGTWLNATDPIHGKLRLKLLAHGERHRRRWHPVFGEGWLVSFDNAASDRFMKERFEADSGHVFPIEWVSIQIGTPEYATRNRRKSTYVKPTDEERKWTTFTLRSGETLAFRDSPPEPASEAAASAPEPQGDLFASGGSR